MLEASYWGWCTWLAACKGCVIVQILELCCQVQELLEEVRSLCGIRKGMKKINWIIF